MACEGRIDSDTASAPLRRRGRPRSRSAERAILLAGARLLEERGVRRMSMEAVAAAARVSKATIYRRWPSKDALVLDLVAGASDDMDETMEPPAAAAADAPAELLPWVQAVAQAEHSTQAAPEQPLPPPAFESHAPARHIPPPHL